MAAAKMCQGKKKSETVESDLRTEQQCLVFVKRMMVVAVSSITYLRGIFPEDAYRSRYLEDLCIKVLREDCKTPGACKVVKCASLSHYQFKFKYTDNGPQMDILRVLNSITQHCNRNENVETQVSMDDTKKASVLLIRKLFLLMQNLGALPNNVNLTMKLYYYDDSKTRFHSLNLRVAAERGRRKGATQSLARKRRV
ncbi:hypothetical protein CRUP_037481 [Coryphaenoides rupestris]|nr:hypothetical protein CRUP_037481 [Coryphaenoides rupestris]